jgi:hypothetical protein
MTISISAAAGERSRPASARLLLAKTSPLGGDLFPRPGPACFSTASLNESPLGGDSLYRPAINRRSAALDDFRSRARCGAIPARFSTASFG